MWHGNGNSDSRDASVQGRDAARRGRRRDATGLDCLRRPEDPNRFSQLMELISGDSVSLSGRSTPLNPLSSSLEKKKENSPLYLHYNGSTSFFLPSARFSVLTSRRRFDRRIRLTRRTSSPGIKNGVEGGGRGGRQCQSNTAEENSSVRLSSEIARIPPAEERGNIRGRATSESHDPKRGKKTVSAATGGTGEQQLVARNYKRFSRGRGRRSRQLRGDSP